MKKFLFTLLFVLLSPILSSAEVAVIMKDGVIFHWYNYKDYGDKYCTYGGSFCILKSDVKEIKEGDNLPAEYRHESKGEGVARYSDNVIRRILAGQQEREQQVRALQSAPIDDRRKIKGEMMERLIKYNQRPNIYKKEIEALTDALDAMNGTLQSRKAAEEAEAEARRLKFEAMEADKPRKEEIEKGAINVRTGEYYPGAAGGIINPKTGDFYPDVGGGYINPKTGEFMPKQ